MNLALNPKATRILKTVVTLVLLAGVTAFFRPAPSQAQPSVIDTAAPSYGRSAWTYRDLSDEHMKYEGGYSRFESTTTALYETSPHGGYDTATNRCTVCHAVHRAQGAYELLRAERRSDACEYCHVASAHSAKVVYDGNAYGTATDVGHRMGASPDIPASTTNVELTSTVMAWRDQFGRTSTRTVEIRTVDANRNRIFQLKRTHALSDDATARSGYMRVGPTSLTCVSCHHVHNAVSEVWRPSAFPGNGTRLAGGYKLLRRAPSGSIQGPDDQPYYEGGPPTVSYTRGMRTFKAYTDFATTGLVDDSATVGVAETTLTPGATYGPGRTVWDSPPFTQPATTSLPATASAAATVTAGVDQFALSVWCADCHNLTAGHFERSFSGDTSLSAHAATATHSSPMVSAGNGPGQCYTCHRTRLAPKPASSYYDPGRAECERCHYGTGSYAVDPFRASGGSDFPHSGEESAAYMLGAWTTDASGSVVATTVTQQNVRRTVCLRCHNEGRSTHGSSEPPDHLSAVATRSISGTMTYASGAPVYYEPPNASVVMTYSGERCGTCHRTELRAEHAKTSAVTSASGCGACHPTPRDTFTTWQKGCEQGGCHTSRHTEMPLKHAQTSAQTTCGYKTSCHDEWNNWDVSAIHLNAWYEWSKGQWQSVVPSAPLPVNGCALCHSSPDSVPAVRTCPTCHPSRPTGHPNVN